MDGVYTDLPSFIQATYTLSSSVHVIIRWLIIHAMYTLSGIVVHMCRPGHIQSKTTCLLSNVQYQWLCLLSPWDIVLVVSGLPKVQVVVTSRYSQVVM